MDFLANLRVFVRPKLAYMTSKAGVSTRKTEGSYTSCFYRIVFTRQGDRK